MAGGGLGEAMLISAAVGGGTSMLTGKDPLEGAMMGAVMGGAGAGLGAFGNAAGTAGSTAGSTAAAAAPTAATTTAAAIPQATNPGIAGLNPAFANTAPTLAAPVMPPPQAMTATGMPNQMLPADRAFAAQATQNSAAATMPAQAGAQPSFLDKTGQYWDSRTGMQQLGLGMAGASGSQMTTPEMEEQKKYSGPLSKYKFDPRRFRPSVAPNFADGGIASLRPPIMVPGPQDNYPQQQFARGGQTNLGGYSDGGRLLRGPGDGVSDGIPASIAGKKPARLADGEFVVPARIVSELGNGSTDAGARHLYAMMDRVQRGRQQNAKQGKFAMDSKAAKHLPA